MGEDQTITDRKKRKEEGRLKKKRRIEEAGGVRPRKDAAATAAEATKQPSRSLDDERKNNSPKPSSSSSFNNETSHRHDRPKPWNNSRGSFNNNNKRNKNNNHHRFGKVMESVPTFDRPRTSTWSIAVPGSVVANCQTRELRTQLVGQIARYATIYHVDEIVVYDDKLAKESSSRSYRRRREENRDKDKDKETTNNNNNDQEENPKSNNTNNNHYDFEPHDFMARVLQYCETPQYLRRHFFPMHPSLQFAGLLAPVDAPHHVRADDHCAYREGVTLDKRTSKGTLVNCGIFKRPVEIPQRLQAGIRCTVKIDAMEYKKPSNQQIVGQVVAPSAPREENGTYWGYTTRFASSIKEVLEDCPFDGGYDLKVGTSERGNADIDHGTFRIPKFSHAIIVFGGVAGIEESVDADESLRLPGSDSRKLFDMWINVCKYQGSRTIRTEEAVLITLAKLSPHFVLDNSNHEHPGKKGSQKKSPEDYVEQSRLVFDDDDAVSEESSDNE